MSRPTPRRSARSQARAAAVDAACAAARTLGGRVVVEPFDASPGRIARLADPAGAEFFVIRYRPAT